MDNSDVCEVYDCNEPSNGEPVVATFVISIQHEERVQRKFKLCEEHHRMFVDNTPCYSLIKE